jgi:hypothetical protein
VWFTEVGAPVAATDREDGEFGNNNGSADRGSNFLAGFDSQTDVTFAVADDHDGLEAGALTGAGLLLNWFDLAKNLLAQFGGPHFEADLLPS